MDKGAGVLMHISSLPGKFGIGTLGKEAYEFVDFIKKAGFKYWQILPLGHIGYGDSPYQCFSAFAGNPYFIDYDELKNMGLLEEKEYVNIDYGRELDSVDYEQIFKIKYDILKTAYNNYKKNTTVIIDEFNRFKKEKAFWLEDYSLYMAVKNHFDLKSWNEWNEDIKKRDSQSVQKYKELLKDEIEYWSFLQFLFFKQWNILKEYKNKLGIKIVGDIPIYVAEDSVDAWSNPTNFKINLDTLKPEFVAGCPPDAFSETGQLWGNPIYNWSKMKENNYEFWIMRIKESLSLYDVCRIDHFRGFEAYWQIPYGDDTAISGEWILGPGMELFEEVRKQLGEVNIIAEDLGYITNELRDFLNETGFPGMKVLQFAFGSGSDNEYLPHNYNKDCIAYTGTHDNDTFLGWYEKTASTEERENAKNYLGLNEEEGCNWGFIRGIWSSVANVAIAPMQDFLNKGNESRMNLPSTLGGNWKWRAIKSELNDNLANEIFKFSKMYGRCE